MKYKKFIIQGYRGITDLTEINISKESLIPIIGKNESGKTTCLEAILAFDHHNDADHNGKHLQNVFNLYSTQEEPVSISAEVDLGKNFKIEEKFKTQFNSYKTEFLNVYPDQVKELNAFSIDFVQNGAENPFRFTNWEYLRSLQLLEDTIKDSQSILIKRDLRTFEYSIPELDGYIEDTANAEISRALVHFLPYTLYFDDFRDRLEEKIFITSDKNNINYSAWIPFINEIFKKTNLHYDIFEMPSKQASMRKSIIREVQKELNRTLIEEWSQYQFEKTGDIVIEIEYQDGSELPYLQFKIIETITIDGVAHERYFDISDRSKGFYWYLNFMIKLHYNPSKRTKDDKDTIYLLDEPGSYLHSFALNKLAKQLKNLSISNKVIYCTHSPSLLNPEYVPINSVRIAEKDKKGKIVFKRLDHIGIIRPKRNSAYQPVFDALEVRPQLTEFEQDNIILVEGIYDYYAFKMFGNYKQLNYFPCVSASSITNQIPYMIFLGKKYVAVWDNDSEGRSRLKKASEQFGGIEAKKFMTLQPIGNAKDTRLEDYFDTEELNKYNNSEDLNKEAFYKFVLKLFYDTNKSKIIKKNFPKTFANFTNLEKILLEKLR